MQTALKYRKAWTANVAPASFTAKIPQTDKPTGSGVFDLFASSVGVATEPYVPEFADLLPYGSDTNNQTLGVRLWGWSQIAGGLWVPSLLAELACTLGNIAATGLGANNFLCDTIAVTTGGAVAGGNGADVISPTTDTAATILIGLRGAELIEFDADTGTPTAASVNCLWRPVSGRSTR